MTTLSPSAPPPAEAPTRIGAWRLVEPLGAGAFGTTWRGVDAAGREAAIKLLSEPPGDEIRALARVQHPAIVSLLGAGGVPVPHVVMGLAPGRSLAEVIAGGPLSEAEALHVIAVLADALAACHRAGICHGDLKPANVLLERSSGRVTLVDFGLSGAEGGTLAYAAPEVASGQPGGVTGDVYALGLLAWELLHGSLPFATDGSWILAADRRAREVPRATVGPEWLRALLSEVLAIAPGARPSAGLIADTLEAKGIELPAPTVAELQLRARSLSVPRPLVDQAVASWLVDRRSLSVVGPPGSGRTHALLRAANELAARGVPFVMIHPSPRPWAAVALALADPGLPGPPEPLPDGVDPIDRADRVAEALGRRTGGTPTVLVDDVASLDRGTALVVESLHNAGATMLIAGEASTTYLNQVALLGPLSPGQVAQMLQGWLGAVDTAALIPTIREVVGLLPGDVVRFVISAVQQGALVYRRRSWVVDVMALERLSKQGIGSIQREPTGLSEPARTLGVLVSLLQPVPRVEALALSGARAGDLSALIDGGWVQGPEVLRCTSAEASRALAAGAHPQRWRRIAGAMLAQRPVAWDRIGRALVGAEDREAIAEHGVRCARASLDLDVADGVELAGEMAALCPTAPLVACHIGGLVRAGRVGQAREAGAAFLDGREAAPEDVPALLAMAHLEDGVSEAPEAILGWTRRAREVLGTQPVPTELQLLEARAWFRGGQLERAEAVTAPLCAGEPDPERPEPWLEARGLLAQIRTAQDRVGEGLALLEALPVEQLAGSRTHALLQGIRGRLLWHAGRPREGARVMEAAAAHRRSLPTVDRARLENNASLCWYAAGDVNRAVVGWERALLGFERVGAVLEATRVQVNLCQGLREIGRWGRAVTAGEAAVAGARRAQNRAFEAVALGNLGDVALDRRQFSEAQRYFDAAEELAERLSLDGELLELARRRSELAAHRRDPDALAVVQAAIDRLSAAGARVELARCRAVAALVLARAGASPEHQASEALGALLELGASGELAIARLWIAEAYLAWGRGDKATLHAEPALRFADEFARAPLVRWAHRILAWARPAEDNERKTLRRLTELAVGVARQVELSDMLSSLAKAAVELVDAERAFVVLGQGTALEVVAQAGELSEHRPSLSVVRRTLTLGREVVVTNLEERGDLRQAESVVAMRLKAVLSVPLFQDGQPAGALYLDSREQPVGALGNQVTLLQALAAHASVALTNARLTQEIQRRARRAREVAHDLRNPLSGILLLAEEVVQTDYVLEPREAELLVDGARHALQLVEDSLRAESVSPIAFSWADAVRRWVTAFQPQARHARVALELSGDAPGQVRGVPVQLRRVLMNLLSNALKFGPPGAPIRIELLGEPERVGLTVQDQGPGLPTELMERLFESGTQGPHATEGYGLGLAIARRICEEHGGRIHVENLQVGCRFTVWLPKVR